jgi:hypothetical protein
LKEAAVAVELPADFDHEAAKALSKLVQEVISDPSVRQAFRGDPVGAAEAAGVDITPIPQRVIGTLAGLTAQELRLLAELNATFAEEGLYVEADNPFLMVL